MSALGIKWVNKFARFSHVEISLQDVHCVKSVRIGSYSGLHFPAFKLNMERYSVSFCLQSECGKLRTRITPNMELITQLPTCTILWKQKEIRHLYYTKRFKWNQMLTKLDVMVDIFCLLLSRRQHKPELAIAFPCLL